MRPIDADALIAWTDNYYDSEKFTVGHFANMVKDMPTIEHPDINVGNIDTTTHDSIPAKTGKNDGDETSGDCISRAQAIYVASGYCHPANIATELAKLPSVQPFHITTMTDVLKYIDDMPEDVWQEFTARLECRGWELKRRTAKWCGGDFA